MNQDDHRTLYEIDHTPLDVLLKDNQASKCQSANVVMRPYLTIRLERESRMIAAAFLRYVRDDVRMSTGEMQKISSESDEKYIENIEPP